MSRTAVGGRAPGTVSEDSRESRKTDPGEHCISVIAWKVSKLSLLKLPIKHLVSGWVIQDRSISSLFPVYISIQV